MVALNRAVAVAMADGPDVGLALVDDLARSGALDGYHLLHATRADLLRRLGRDDEAAAAYREAIALAPGEPEQRFLRRRLARAVLAGRRVTHPRHSGDGEADAWVHGTRAPA